MTPLHLALILLATARLTRLVTGDQITERPRVWLTLKLEGHPQLQYLLHCPWCASMYVGAVVAGAWWAWGDTMWLMMVYAALSASYATGFLASKTEG